MTDLIETIRISDGSYHDLDSHLDRMLKSSLEAFGEKVIIGEELLRIPEDLRSGTVKCRIRYNTQIEDVVFSPYSRRTIDSLRLVGCMRQKLLREGKAAAVPVRPSDIHTFEKVFLINAMLAPGDIGISTSCIFQ